MKLEVHDAITMHLKIAHDIQTFLWKGKPYKSERKRYDVEEYEAFLKRIEDDAMMAYNTAAYELDWK